MSDVLIVGGGAAGLMAACSASQAGANVTLFEHNEKLGKKIYITGKGRCNLTNDCSCDEFMREVARNPRFLFSALSVFSPQDLMRFMEDNGLPLVTERGRRVYPASYKASDVTRTLENVMRARHVRILLNQGVKQVLTENGHVTGIETVDGDIYRGDRVILATGGLAYPSTGSTGDGYRMAQSLGHTLVRPVPSLTALETQETWPQQLQGLSLKNVSVVCLKGKKTLYEGMGEMLFTHFGVSGPIILEMSCHLPDDVQGVPFSLNLKPALTQEQLTLRLQREFDEQPRKHLATVMETLLPSRFAALFPQIAGVDGQKTCAGLTRQEREQIRSTLQCVPLTIRGRRPFAEAIVTRGGISVKEVYPATMESRLVSGLYLCGELLDLDAHTGGYNLTIAFSTGYLAGQSAAQQNP